MLKHNKKINRAHLDAGLRRRVGLLDGAGQARPALFLCLFCLFAVFFCDAIPVFANEKGPESVNLPVDLTSAEEKKAQEWDKPAKRAENTAPVAAAPDGASKAAGEQSAEGAARKAEALRRSLVRLPMLPNRTVESFVPDNKRPKLQKKEEEAAKQPQKPDPEAYAAFAAYKKKQLEALESDRQTLQALQEAIQDLGLSQKLSFSGSNLTPPKGSAAAKPTLPQK